MPKPVTLLYFAALRDAAGTAEESAELPDDVQTVAALAAWFERRPAFAGRLASVRFAVNEAFAEPETSLAAGDVIALIPPVSGG
jgi:molybdopterin synthase sulfur carrier subunit